MQLTIVVMLLAAGAFKTAGASDLAVTFSPEPKDTQTTIAGTISGNPDAIAAVKAVYIEVLNGTDRVQGPVDGKYAPPNNTFSAAVAALQEGQSVHVHLCGPASAGTFVDTSASCTLQTASANNYFEIYANGATSLVTSLYDLGRVRAYFSVGKGWPGSSAGFFALNIDENWLYTGPNQAPQCYSPADSAGFRLASSRPGRGCGEHSNRVLINTYLEADLMQIPLSTNPVALNVTSAKGAYIEAGLYEPVMPAATQWTFRGQENGLFFAPVYKVAFLIPGGSSPGAGIDVYRAYSGGVRFGHYRLPAHFDRSAPALLSYLDITVGAWENFREADGARGLRLAASGRIEIPYTPFYAGFAVSMGPGGSGYSIFAGARVDVSTILGKLIPAAN